MAEAAPKIDIKGIREGLLVSIGDGASWETAEAALLNAIGKQADFFNGARVALDVGARPLKAAQLGKLRDRLSDFGITLWAVISESPKTQETARSLGLEIHLSKPRPGRVVKPLEARAEGEEALMVRRTLRSGMRVTFPGHVIVLGNVNAGAEIIAGGDIIVWGRLKGVAHAGASGNTAAVVCALDLSPTQLRIADLIATAPPRRGNPTPEIASVKDGQVVAESWHGK